MLEKIDKKKILNRLIEGLQQSISTALKAAEDAKAGIQVGAERTRSRGERAVLLEHTYLITAQMKQAENFKSLIEVLKSIDLARAKSIKTGSLVLLREEPSGKEEIFFLLPGGMGTSFEWNELKITIVSPSSPLGIALERKRVGRMFNVRLPGGVKKYRVVEIN